MVAKAEKTGGGRESGEAAPARRSRIFNNKPSWLLCSIADLDDRMKMLPTRKSPKENSSADSFAARANSYYHERPQLLELLQDLYNGYLSLADRYCQALASKRRPHSRCSSPAPPLKFNESFPVDGGDDGELVESDAESSISFQPPIVPIVQAKQSDTEMILADFVIKMVESEIILNELKVVEKRLGEASTKMELQTNLLNVLDSERLILLNDNATLGYRVKALVEENKGLASESLFLKRKAAELARCVLNTRDDYRVCMLSRKIEDLQGQIYGLEKRNTEYNEKIIKQEKKNKLAMRNGKDGDQVTLEDCLQERVVGGGGGIGLMKCFAVNVKRDGDRNGNGVVEGVAGRVSKLWDKFKNFDSFGCGAIHSTSC